MPSTSGRCFPISTGPAAIIRPANMPDGNPGRGSVEVTNDGMTLYVANLCGRVFMDAYDDPFRMVDAHAGKGLDTPSPDRFPCRSHERKNCDGLASWTVAPRPCSAPTPMCRRPDERILPGGTAAITDVGMTGPYESVLGMNKDVVLTRFKTGMPTRFEVADKIGVISGVVLDVERLTGRATSIKRVRSEA